MPAKTAKRREQPAHHAPLNDPLSILLTSAAEDASTDPRVHQWLKKLLGGPTAQVDCAEQGQKRKRASQ